MMIFMGKVAHFEIVPYQRYTGTTIGTTIVPVQKLVQRTCAEPEIKVCKTELSRTQAGPGKTGKQEQ